MSEKRRDEKNRWRSRTVGFRVSPEEGRQLDIAVQLSGLSKQDYIIRRILGRDSVAGKPAGVQGFTGSIARGAEGA